MCFEDEKRAQSLCMKIHICKMTNRLLDQIKPEKIKFSKTYGRRFLIIEKLGH